MAQLDAQCLVTGTLDGNLKALTKSGQAPVAVAFLNDCTLDAGASPGFETTSNDSALKNSNERTRTHYSVGNVRQSAGHA